MKADAGRIPQRRSGLTRDIWREYRAERRGFGAKEDGGEAVALSDYKHRESRFRDNTSSNAKFRDGLVIRAYVLEQ